MDIKLLILEEIKKTGQIKAAEIVKNTGFSRAYVNRFFQELRDEGKVVLIGKANRAFYILSNSDNFTNLRNQVLEFGHEFVNQKLSEDDILKEVKQMTGIFSSLPNNVDNILEYSFLEMVNNAIEHSGSEKIKIKIKREGKDVVFTIEDWGVGIFENIKNKFKLPDTLTAVQELLKGKKTTEPTQHSGQGIFFTSKLADSFTIKSSNKVLMFNNIVSDLFIEDRKSHVGTTIIFSINLDTQKTTKEIFDAFTNQEYEFSKTQVKIKLFRVGKNILSRSEARRVMIGLESFQDIILDFQDVESIGQAFADEIFRVWKNNHPNINIAYLNANENVEFMIKRAV
jgi:anti-sigma regulatory factor (Ser/Thr protein kinase)